MRKEKIIIFDTTLRDGEQSPGASLNIKEKLQIAEQLMRLGVDVIEAGFPVSSVGDFEAVKKVSQKSVKSSKKVIIAGLARSLKKDIEVCFEAIKYANYPRIHKFIATSDIHLKYKLKKTKAQVLKQAIQAVKLAKKLTDDVEFSAEDAARSDIKFLKEVIEATIDAGATTINIPDTVGYAIPEEFGNMIRYIFENVSNSDKAIFSVHCHNDLGLAVANSLTAVQNGVRQVECTINGLGERAGNASLEEIVMAIKTRKDFFNFYTSVNTTQIFKTSRLVSKLTGIPVQPNKAIVGKNAFAHEAGIHQDGIIKKELTYEIMTPQSVGVEKSNLVLGKHSGRHAFRKKLEELGFSLNEKELNVAFEKFKGLADKKKEVYDEDLEAIVEEEISYIPETFSLEYISVSTGNKTVPTATVILKKGEHTFQEASCGDGPVDATYKAIDRIVKLPNKLIDYGLNSISSGKDALGEVTVKISTPKETISGRASSTDIIEASAKAYLNALNKLIYKRQKEQRA